jgi:octaprenyl-diphosphate synthase
MHLDLIKSPVKEELKSFQEHFKKSVKSDIPLLNIVLNYILRTKGKQIRPLFVLLSAKIHGEITNSTYTAASLIELLHTATLIHDDVVDEAYERRGFFSINALWKSKVAVLIGDYLLSKGLLLSMDENEVSLLKIVTKAVKEMIEGELLQIQKSKKLNITEEHYFRIIRKKTATLIAACCACGTKSVNRPDAEVEKMWEFGEKLGIAFQIKDDLLDYSTNGITGKAYGNDIKEKKITLPLIYSLQNSPGKSAKKVLTMINKDSRNNEKIRYIIDFVTETGGLQYAESKMNEYKEQAVNLLHGFNESDSLNALIKLSEYITIRKK